MPVFLQNIGGRKSRLATAKPVFDIAKMNAQIEQNKRKEETARRVEQARSEADRYAQEAKDASSLKGMALNALKAAPKAALDVTIGNIPKLAVSAYEAPEIAVNYMMNKSGFPRQVTPQRTYSGKVFGKQVISPFKSFQSDFEDVANDVIEGKRGLGSAAWSLVQAPLAGAEVLGIGKGLGKAGGSISQAIKAPSLSASKEAALDVVDAFLPTTRGMGQSKTEQALRRELAGLQEQKMRAALETPRPRPEQYVSGVKLQAKPLAETPAMEPKLTQETPKVEMKAKTPLHEEARKYKSAEEFQKEIIKRVEAPGIGENTPNTLKGTYHLKMMKTNDISFGGQTGSQESIRSAEKAIKEGKSLPPITINPNGYFANNEVIDGNHRLTAYKNLGVKEIPVLVKEGDNGKGISNLTDIWKEANQTIPETVPQQKTTLESPLMKTKGKITTPKVNYKKQIEQSLGITDRTPRTPELDAKIADIEKRLQNRALAVGDVPVEQAKTSIVPNFLRSGERSLEMQGEAGKTLRKLIEEEQLQSDILGGKWTGIVKKQTAGLNDAQKSNLTDVLEGKADAMDDVVKSRASELRTWLDKVQGVAKEAGLDVGYRENYFPRQYNWDDMTKTKRRDEILDHMVTSGQASTKAEAAQFLESFIGKNRERKAGNLEFERMFDIPGYERDPEKALVQYAQSAARRINEAKFFGKKDEIPSALINKIAAGGGDYNEAQRVFDYVYKGEPNNAFANFLTGYNTFTKLSLAFFSNLTQSVNTAAKGGLLNTIKGASRALAEGVNAVKGKDYNDIALLSGALQDVVQKQELGFTNRAINGAMWLFQRVENFNRRTAAYAGKFRAEELAEIVSKNPEAKAAVRQLKSLGIDVVDVANGKLTDDQLLRAANLMTKKTQFKVDAMSIPPAWRTPMGKVLSQFKSFSFIQTKFIRDEIIKEAGNGNFAPLLRFLILAPTASYVTQSARNWVNNAEKEMSYRDFDLYRKSVGDIPSDIAAQMKYAYDKSQETYTDKRGRVFNKTSALQDLKNYTSSFTGPTVSDVLSLGSAIDRISDTKDKNLEYSFNHPEAQRDPYLDLKRFGVQKIPFAGNYLKNTYFGYEPTIAQRSKDLMKEGIRTNNRDLIDQAIRQDPYLYNERVIQGIIGKKIKGMSESEKALYREIQQKRKQKLPYFND